MRDPGIEIPNNSEMEWLPGSSAWKAEILTARLIALENFRN